MGQKSFVRLQELGQTYFMAAVRKSSSSLHIEECDFTWLILSKIFYLVLFICINYHVNAKWKIEKVIVK